MTKWLLLAALLLSGCAGKIAPSIPLSWPTPGPGQWATAFGRVDTVQGAVIPLQPASGVHYVYTQAAGLVLGKTMSLTYTLSGNAKLTHDDPADLDPPTISLFIWAHGDNLSCQGQFAGYRQFMKLRPNLTYGTHTVSAVLDPTNWTGCYPNQADGAFIAAVANAAYMGFTLSGQDFAGHGVDEVAGTGSATLTIDAFGVQ